MIEENKLAPDKSGGERICSTNLTDDLTCEDTHQASFPHEAIPHEPSSLGEYSLGEYQGTESPSMSRTMYDDLTCEDTLYEL